MKSHACSLLSVRRFVLLVALALAWSGATRTAWAEGVPIGLVYATDQVDELAKGKDGLLHYRRAVEAAGGQVVVLSPRMNDTEMRAALSALAGVLVPGGDDLSTHLYGQRPTPWTEPPDRSLDAFEMKVVRWCIAQRRPVLGICRGHQLLNVALGGTLYQDLPRQRGVRLGIRHRLIVQGRSKPQFHAIHIQPDTRLSQALLAHDVRVNSTHHQAVRRLGQGLKITARAADGVVEAVESRTGLPLLGVQFHPERLRLQDARFDGIFRWLVREAGRQAVKVR